jgi:hypothetical protein
MLERIGKLVQPYVFPEAKPKPEPPKSSGRKPRGKAGGKAKVAGDIGAALNQAVDKFISHGVKSAKAKAEGKERVLTAAQERALKARLDPAVAQTIAATRRGESRPSSVEQVVTAALNSIGNAPLQWRKSGTACLGKDRRDYPRWVSDRGGFQYIPVHSALGTPAYRLEPFTGLSEVEDIIDEAGNLRPEAIAYVQKLYDAQD